MCLCRPVFIVLACAIYVCVSQNTLVRALVPICLYSLNCLKFDPLILRKIIKIVATRCQILRLKCTKFDFGWGSAPDPAGGAYSAPPDPLAGFKGPTSKERGRREGEGGQGRGGEEKGREGRGEEIRPAPSKYIWIDAAGPARRRQSAGGRLMAARRMREWSCNSNSNNQISIAP